MCDVLECTLQAVALNKWIFWMVTSEYLLRYLGVCVKKYFFYWVKQTKNLIPSNFFFFENFSRKLIPENFPESLLIFWKRFQQFFWKSCFKNCLKTFFKIFWKNFVVKLYWKFFWKFSSKLSNNFQQFFRKIFFFFLGNLKI